MRRVARPVVHMPISGGIEIPGQEKKIIYAVSTAMYGKCDFAAGLTNDRGQRCMAEAPDVIVVGAGVMGCGTAYWLTKAGYKVLVLEQEAIARGASGMAAAMLESVGHGARNTVPTMGLTRPRREPRRFSTSGRIAAS